MLGSNARTQSSTAARRWVHPKPTLTTTRLMKEYRDLTADPLQDSITAGPISEDNMLEWEALIQGPDGTPYVSIEANPLIARKEVYSPPSFVS
jgi:ubiquitin-conjugating enzyme E2 G2